MKHPIVNIAIQAARAAANIIMRALDRLETVKIQEKAPNDYVTEIDRMAEREIIHFIQRAHPSHSILGEESGKIVGNDNLWIIDPLDGTRNFIHGFPHFAISIAFSFKNKIEHGVIYDPIRQELFTASRGKGAQLNDHRIRVSKHSHLEECLLGTGFPYRHSADEQKAYFKTLEALIPICGDIRRSGSATLDLAYVAAGRLDGFWELGLKPWDLAAGTLLIREAGGLVSDLAGGDNFMKTGHVVTANPKILKLLIKKIHSSTLSAT